MSKRALSDKAKERNGAIDPRQLALVLEDSDRKSGVSPDDRDAARAHAIVASLDRLSSEEVFAAFEDLDALPTDVVRAALAPKVGPAPDPELLDDATRRAHGFPLRPLRLRTVAAVKDADIFDFGDVAEEQLRLAGKSWDGRDLAAEERLDGEIEGTFAGTLVRCVLADASSSTPLFDVLLYAGNAGSIFRAGTTELVGAVADGTVEMKDRRARLAIQDALAVTLGSDESPAAAEVDEAEVEAPPAPKKVKTTAAKKTSAKASAEKSGAKRSAAKKSTAKKISAKAAGATAATKTAAKTTTGKATAKKMTAKRATAKKAAKKVADDD